MKLILLELLLVLTKGGYDLDLYHYGLNIAACDYRGRLNIFGDTVHPVHALQLHKLKCM